ncbi:zinc-binding alcohol dehydrogenase family protein [Actinoplanes sp. NBRC 103695]|uniref:quinone oxidoreductase family protein n=1 Tax=Actinoplanes sp. NBRC 103695 TaxID=3032202 RepID=UPI002556808C|nr:zinc-binding alcohol dehydrogenase family protein [Actinoplanes sp. NBRC 103695]
MMRAAVIDTCGLPPLVSERPEPATGPGEVRVHVTAASITPLDLLCASGTSYFGAPATPYVPGVQGVGVLDDGTPVWFATSAGMRPGDGSMAEWAVAAHGDIVPLPEGVDHRLVAALGLSAVAALMALTWRGDLRAGEQVLVLGGGGVVGQAAIQLARLHGASRVVAECRSDAAQRRAERAGASAVVRLDEPCFDERLAEQGPIDLVVDPVFGAPAVSAMHVLRPGGRLVNLGSSAGESAPFDSATLRGKHLSLLGYTNTELTKEQRADAVAVIAEHVRGGRLTLDYETVAFADIADAWTRQATGKADRRLVVVL